MSHTPGPWWERRPGTARMYRTLERVEICGGDPNSPLVVAEAHSRADGEEIIRRVNAFPKLLAACEAIKTWLCDHWGEGPIDGDDLSLVEADVALDTAIAAAKGE